VFISFWGFLFLFCFVGACILLPLQLYFKPSAGAAFRNRAGMVLLGGFLLRVVVLFASNSIAVHRVASGGG